MTLQQLLSPAVLEWYLENNHLQKDMLLKEFNKWVVENENKINESVKNNLDKINEHIERGKEKTRLLRESTEDDIDWENIDFGDFSEDSPKKVEKPISGKVESEDDDEPKKPKTTIADKLVLSNKEDSENNLYDVINGIYDYIEEEKLLDKPNEHLWGSVDVSGCFDMSALFAFTEMRNADLSSWDVSKVKFMEGMFYKSTFNNDSICEWDVSSCTDFLRMFTYSDFNQDISGWLPGMIEKTEYDADGKPYKVTVRADLPLIGAAADEQKEARKNRLYKRLKSLKPSKELKENKSMKHILDYNTFVNEGFGDFVKKGVNKIKSFFKDITLKLGNLVTMFDSKGNVFNASSPYTALNFISDGEVKGVTAFSTEKSELLNDNVKSIATIVESPEYYGIVDKNSIEYRNYLTMVDMVNEHYSKYGDKLNEAVSGRVGFSGESGGLKDSEDINSKTLKFLLNEAIQDVPAYKDEDYGGAILIWGAPGVGKSTIPKSIIEAWNDNHKDELKALLVVECGNLTVDGFSLPIPIKKRVKEYVKEYPSIGKSLSKRFNDSDFNLDDFLNEEVTVSAEAMKTWLPVYKISNNNSKNEIMNDIANGRQVRKNKNGRLEVTPTTEGGIILFDEFFRANENIFKILMQLILTRTFNDEYILGNKWAILACSNRPNDDDEVDDGFSHTGAVIGTRFGGGQYNFIPDFDDWKKWAVTKGHFDDATITFLMQQKDPSTGEYTNWHTIRPEEQTGGKSVWPTPRTWSSLMKELNNIRINNKWESISEIPMDIIRLKASGIIGKEMANNYVQFLSTFQSSFSPDEVLNNPKYSIPNDMKCSEVIDRLKKYIDLKFDMDNKLSDEQAMNMFNTLEKTFNESKDNYVRPLYVSIFNKFDFIKNPTAFGKEYFPKFIIAFMKKYGLKNGAEIKDFII